MMYIFTAVAEKGLLTSSKYGRRDMYAFTAFFSKDQRFFPSDHYQYSHNESEKKDPSCVFFA